MLLLLCVLGALSSVSGIPSLTKIHTGNSPDCGAGWVFKACLYGCQEICNFAADSGCPGSCRPSCVCPEGTILESLHSLRCVPRSQCPSVGGNLGGGGGSLSALGDGGKGEHVSGLQSRAGLGGLLSGGRESPVAGIDRVADEGGFLSGVVGENLLGGLLSGVRGGGVPVLDGSLLGGLLSGGGGGVGSRRGPPVNVGQGFLSGLVGGGGRVPSGINEGGGQSLGGSVGQGPGLLNLNGNVGLNLG